MDSVCLCGGGGGGGEKEERDQTKNPSMVMGMYISGTTHCYKRSTQQLRIL